MNKIRQTLFSCAVGIALCLIVTGIVGWVTAANTNAWYYALQKPVFNPPSWLFGPVWTVLYIMIGIAGGLLWQKHQRLASLWFLYLLQLVFNFIWSILFFYYESISWALVDIILLWVTLLSLLLMSARRYRPVFYWLILYFCWVSFATVLNFSLWILN